MTEVEKQPGTAALALRFAILTATRTSEVIGATWGEIDIVERAWSVPAERMKSGRPHRVPLSDAALDLLQTMKPDAEGCLFPGAKRSKPMSNMSMAMVLRRMGRDDLTVHGFRSSFRDWCSETGKPGDLAEAALAHVVGDKTVAAYLRGDLFDRRRTLMAQWAAHCRTVAPTAGEVVRLHG